MKAEGKNAHKGRKQQGKKALRTRRSRLRLSLAIGITVGCITLSLAVHAYNRRAANATSLLPPASTTAAVPSAQQPQPRISANLSLQPQADKLRRRLGKRFVVPGQEAAAQTGTLTSDGQTFSVRLLRNHDDTGEQLALAFDNGPASLTWSAKDGAKLAGGPINNAQRQLLERLALDSPDQFVLAQLRGASYFDMAHYVAPPEAANNENYTGPLWDVVRVGEPVDGAQNKPQSLWRLYYLNCYTGLLEKIVYQENSDTITAEISGWQDIGGEKVPVHFTWKRNQQIFMELSLNNITHGPIQ